MINLRKRLKFRSLKVNGLLDLASFWWLVAVLVFLFARYSDIFTADKPSSGLTIVLKEYNPLFACLSIPFSIFLAVKLTEFFLIRLKSEIIELKSNSLLTWLIKHYHMSYKADQLVLKDETIILAWQFMFCMFSFFIELKWYLAGLMGMAFYLCIYIILSFRDIKTFIKKLTAGAI